MPTDADTRYFEVQCHHCQWKGFVSDLVKVYEAGSGEGVEKLVACPSCLEWDELEED